jgi:adenylylsulfate kinase
MDTKLRSLLKAFSYRAMGSFVTAILVLVVTNRATLALSVGLLDSVVKILAYFLHERVWAKIPYGRVESRIAPYQSRQ